MPLSRNKIRTLTNFIRETYNINNEGPFPVLQFLEIFLDCFGYNYEIVDDNKLVSCYALTIPVKKTIKIAESTYNDAASGNPRARFTIAHEIGHAVLHDKIDLGYARVNSNEIIKDYENPEWQANTFAAELLVPIQYIGGLSCEEIAQKYCVSKKVAQIQSSYI